MTGNERELPVRKPWTTSGVINVGQRNAVDRQASLRQKNEEKKIETGSETLAAILKFQTFVKSKMGPRGEYEFA